MHIETSILRISLLASAIHCAHKLVWIANKRKYDKCWVRILLLLVILTQICFLTKMSVFGNKYADFYWTANILLMDFKLSKTPYINRSI